MGGTDVAVPELVAGRYRVTAVLEVSRGLETWRATDECTGEVVIVKVCRAPVLSATARARLDLESEVLQRLNHPWLAPLLDWGWEPDMVFFVMPSLPGVTLTQRLRDGPLGLPEWLTVGLCLATGLAAAHEHDVVHGAVNPDNVVVDGRAPLTGATLVDFGAVRRAMLVAPGHDQAEHAHYLSPEQAGLLPRPVDARADLYSLGVVLYECLAGHPPFEAPGLSELLRQHLSAPPPPVPGLGVAVPEVVDEIVRRLLGKDPGDRYQSAAALAADLEAVAECVARGAAVRVVVGAHDRRRTLAEPAMVGREAELAAFEHYLEQAGQGEGTLVLLESESGGGKSRLLDEVGRRATARGFWVLRGQGAGDAPVRPLQVVDGIVDGIRSSVAMEPALAPQLDNAVGSHRDALVEVVPELRAVVGGGDGPVGPDEYGEVRSAAAVAALLDALGSPERPALVLLDDCQWADELSVEAITRWQRDPSRPGLRHVLVVVSLRSHEVADGHPLRKATSARIRLSPLDNDEIGQLAESMAGRLPAPALSVVLDLARGNPFMASAVLHGLTETGALVAETSGWRFDGMAAGLQSSRRAAEVLAQRLEHLAEETRRLLSAGAVLGSQFDLELAARLAVLPLATGIAAAADAQRHQLVWAAEESCTFVHDRLREACSARLSANERASLHEQAAAILRTLDPIPAFDVAYHLDAAGIPSEAVPYALAAAASARARHSLQVAEEQYRIADRGLDPDDGRHLLVAEGLGNVLMLRGRYAEAERQLTRARGLAAGDVAAARLEGELGELALKRGDVEGASDHAERALRRLGQPVPRRTSAVLLMLAWEVAVLLARPLRRRLAKRTRAGEGGETRARLTAALSARLLYAWWFRRGSLAAAWAQLRQLHLADRCPPGRELGHAYAIHGAALTAAAPLLSRRGRSFAAQAVAIQDAVGDLWGRGQARHFQAAILHASSRYAEARATCTEAAEFLDRAGDRWELNTARWHRALCRYRLGDLRGAIDEAQAVHQTGVELGDAQAAAMGLEIWAKASGGRVPAEAVRQGLDQGGRDVQTTVALLQAEGLRLLASGRPADAVAALERAERLIRRRRVANVYVASVRPWLATARRRVAEDAPAWAPRQRALLLRKARRAARRALRSSRLYRNDRPHALREAALVAAMDGRTRRARRLLGQSLTLAIRQEAAAEASETRRVRSRLATAIGWRQIAEDRAAEPLPAEGNLGLDGIGAVPPATTPGLADRLDALLEAGRHLASTSSPEALNEAVRDAILTLLRPEWCGLAAVDAEGRLMLGDRPDPRWRALEALVSEALDFRQTVILVSETGSAGDRRPIDGVRSALAAPVMTGGRPVAVVLATHTLADLFGEVEGRLSDFIVTLAGAARERDLAQRAVRGEVIAAQEAERTRVARDLHDEVGQSLTSVLLTLRLLEASLEAVPENAGGPLKRVGEVRDLVNDTLRQVRRLVFELRPPTLDDLGLVAAVRRLVGDVGHRHGVAVDLVTAGLDGTPRFSAEVETAVYRVVQEALTNIVRHSGADAGSVILAYGADGLRAVVEDEGRGFHPEAATLASFGLRGMAERAELVGGAFRITSAPGSGTTVVLEVPIA